MRPNGKWVVVTGASTGIGRACALHLAERGYQVIAGYRHAADAEQLRIEGIWPERIDVRDSACVAQLAARVKSLAGDGLCGLVNNAGIAVAGPIEYLSIDDWRRQFEVNVFGQIAMTQAMLPLLRLHVAALGKGAARIVMMGSIAGKVAQPILAPYCASKFALEAVSDSLRLELHRQGIYTSLIEPGAVVSEIWRKGRQSGEMVSQGDLSRAHYGLEIDRLGDMAQRASRQALPADTVARAVADALTRRVPRTRYVVGKDAKMSAIAKRLLPDRMWDRAVLRAFGMKD